MFRLLQTYAVGWDDASMIQPTYVPNSAAGQTQISPGLTLWNEVDFSVAGYQGYDVSGVIRLHGKRLELDELTVHRQDDGEQITGFGLRGLQPPAIIRRSLSVLATYPPGGEALADSATDFTALGVVRTEDVDAAKAAGPTDTTLSLVGRVYAAAYAAQDRPAKTVAELFAVSPRTAGAWIAKAKAAGHIITEDENDGTPTA